MSIRWTSKMNNSLDSKKPISICNITKKLKLKFLHVICHLQNSHQNYPYNKTIFDRDLSVYAYLYRNA